MTTVTKVAAIILEDNSTGETGMIPLDEVVYDFYDSQEEADRETVGVRVHHFEIVGFSPEEWASVCSRAMPWRDRG